MSCPDCFTGHVHEGTPTGKTVTLHGLDTYVAEPAKGTKVKGVIVFIPDAFGWEFVNNRILADSYAKNGGYRVYLPDFMRGTAAPVSMIESVKGLVNPGSIFKKLYAVPFLVYTFVPFIYHNRAGKSYPVVKKFMVDIRENEAADLHVGAAGFCWGGKHVVLLAGDEERVNGKPLIDAGYTAHPSMLTIPADIENIKRPVAFACAEADHSLSLELVQKIKAIVEEKPAEAKGEVVIYEGCGHGFAVRADLSTKDVAKQADAAEAQSIRWFDKHFGVAE